MPYKDPEKRKAYAKEYYKTYTPEWRKKHPGYHGRWGAAKRAEDPERFRQYEKNRTKSPAQRRREYLSKPENLAKSKARAKLRYEVKKGRVIVPTRCEKCRQELPLQPDHHNYSQPLNVVWLCKTCHIEITVRRLKMGLSN